MRILSTEDLQSTNEGLDIFGLIDPGFWDLVTSGYEALKAARDFRNQTKVVRNELNKVLHSIENLPYYEAAMKQGANKCIESD